MTEIKSFQPKAAREAIRQEIEQAVKAIAEKHGLAFKGIMRSTYSDTSLSCKIGLSTADSIAKPEAAEDYIGRVFKLRRSAYFIKSFDGTDLHAVTQNGKGYRIKPEQISEFGFQEIDIKLTPFSFDPKLKNLIAR